ncbi:hypothetical protein PsYK624_098150 [Phanerochaete sordida]|uniref:Uncharacterized protein n=1 Tax=Phanerochaete sordida TaxID=48140 RepID=A0A9P3LFV3_9APHY|nr:hypothetical protein PsYK624_098150 [Phanerochaete sordida]
MCAVLYDMAVSTGHRPVTGRKWLQYISFPAVRLERLAHTTASRLLDVLQPAATFRSRKSSARSMRSRSAALRDTVGKRRESGIQMNR